MENNKFKNDISKSTKNLLKLPKKTVDTVKKVDKNTKRVVKIIKLMARIIHFVLNLIVSSPVIFLIVLIGTILLSIYLGLMGTKNFDIEQNNKVNTVISKQEIQSLGIPIDDKGKIIECSNLSNPEIIFTSPIADYISGLTEESTKKTEQYCFYNLLFNKLVKGDFNLDRDIKDIDDLKKNSKDSKLISKKEDDLNKKRAVLNKLKFIDVHTNVFKQYENDEYGYQGRFNYPNGTFGNKDLMLKLIYNYRFAIANSFGISEKDRTLLKITDINAGNSLNELNGYSGGLDDFRDVVYKKLGLEDSINSECSYYHFNCPPCTSKICTCTGDPKTDYGADFKEDKKALAILDKYLDFIDDLNSRNVIYASENIYPPFRNYRKISGEECKTNITLTQRDGASELMFFGFLGYPKVNGVRTHAGLDIVGYSPCDGKNPPVYSIADGEVVSKTYSLTAWGHSLIIRSYILGGEYYIRYSHLLDDPLFEVGDTVDFNSVIGFQGSSGPSKGEHLDLTIYVDKRTDLYSHYLRNTLELGGGYPITFEDIFKDKTLVNSYKRSCYNCNK